VKKNPTSMPNCFVSVPLNPMIEEMLSSKIIEYNLNCFRKINNTTYKVKVESTDGQHQAVIPVLLICKKEDIVCKYNLEDSLRICADKNGKQKPRETLIEHNNHPEFLEIATTKIKPKPFKDMKMYITVFNNEKNKFERRKIKLICQMTKFSNT